MLEQKIQLTDASKNNYYYEEAIKTLRTNLQFSGKNNKAILITSTVPGEGKSDISFGGRAWESREESSSD